MFARAAPVPYFFANRAPNACGILPRLSPAATRKTFAFRPVGQAWSALLPKQDEYDRTPPAASERSVGLKRTGSQETAEALSHWERFVGGAEAEAAPRRVILDSWRRSRGARVDARA